MSKADKRENIIMVCVLVYKGDCDDNLAGQIASEPLTFEKGKSLCSPRCLTY